MQNLKSQWKKTQKKFDELEKELVDSYILFLRGVARFYLEQNRRVFFHENNVVHWGEGNFGRLVIEGNEDTYDVFGDYISEIQFKADISPEIIRGFTEIKNRNLKDIRYGK